MLSKEYYLDLAGGKFNETTQADLAHLFAALEQAPAKDHLVVHFHGGLVSRTMAETAAEGCCLATPKVAPIQSSFSGAPIFGPR
jgi:hypothetical protein